MEKVIDYHAGYQEDWCYIAGESEESILHILQCTQAGILTTVFLGKCNLFHQYLVFSLSFILFFFFFCYTQQFSTCHSKDPRRPLLVRCTGHTLANVTSVKILRSLYCHIFKVKFFVYVNTKWHETGRKQKRKM